MQDLEFVEEENRKRGREKKDIPQPLRVGQIFFSYAASALPYRAVIAVVGKEVVDVGMFVAPSSKLPRLLYRTRCWEDATGEGRTIFTARNPLNEMRMLSNQVMEYPSIVGRFRACHSSEDTSCFDETQY